LPTPSPSFLPLAVTAFLALPCGCGPGFGARPCSADDASILVTGDSILAYHADSCGSVADVASEALGRPIHNAARSGARVSPGPTWLWGDIREQVTPGDWDWVVVEGGIDDLLGDCECGGCTDVLDELVSADGARGEVPALVDQALADGARVALVGYYDPFLNARGGYGACGAALDTLRTRYRHIAAQRDGVIVVEPQDVMSPDDTPDAYLPDGIHPSREGSARLGLQLAEAIAAAEGSEHATD
jgi:lysophospholipase L1-like esterase